MVYPNLNLFFHGWDTEQTLLTVTYLPLFSTFRL